MIKVNVEPGNCNLSSQLTCVADKDKRVVLKGKSACPYVRELLERLSEKDLNGFQEVFQKGQSSQVLSEARVCLAHKTCPVPLAMLKAIEASCGLSLAQDVRIEMKKIDD